MADVIVFGDAEAAVIAWLNSRLDAPVMKRIPATRPSTFVTVQRTGGPRANLVTDNPQLTIEAWAQTPADAHDLAQLARAHLHAMTGENGPAAQVRRVEEFSGPGWLPDPDSTQPRYTFTVSVWLRAVTA